MIPNNSDSCPPPKLTLINSKPLDFLQEVYHSTNLSGGTSLEDLSKRVTAVALPFLQAIPPLKQEINFTATLNKERLFKKKRYRPRKWKGHSYERHVQYCIMEILQRYDTVFKGIVRPTRQTIADQIGVCLTTIDKYMKKCVTWGVLQVVSGKAKRIPNQYKIHPCYRKTPIPTSGDLKLNHHLWYPLKRMVIKERHEKSGFFVFEQILTHIGQYLLRRRENITNFFRLGSKINLKATTDPPKERKKPPNWHLFAKYNLHYRDQWILARYSEFALRQAIDDLDFYISEGHEVRKVAAYIVGRCKAHQASHELDEGKKTMSPVDWLKGFLTRLKSKLNFITGIEEREDSKINVNFKEHKTEPQKSMLNIYQKVNGCWIDKAIPLDRPDFACFTETYLENALKTLRFTKMAENAF